MIKYDYKPIVLPNGEVKIAQVPLMPSLDEASVGDYQKSLEMYIHGVDNPVLFSCVGGDRSFWLNNLGRTFHEDDIYFQCKDRDYPLTIAERVKRGVGPEVFAGYRHAKNDQLLAINTIYNMLMSGKGDLDGAMGDIMRDYKFVKIR